MPSEELVSRATLAWLQSLLKGNRDAAEWTPSQREKWAAERITDADRAHVRCILIAIWPTFEPTLREAAAELRRRQSNHAMTEREIERQRAYTDELAQRLEMLAGE